MVGTASRGGETRTSRCAHVFDDPGVRQERGRGVPLDPTVGGQASPRRTPALAKRSMDVVGATVLLILLVPVFAGLAILIKRDGGPVFFRHRRIGRSGVAFQCIKFRTMSVDAEAVLEHLLANNAALRQEWNRNFKLRNDPRVTPIGRWIRRISADELPQLLNVLRGEMSLVGPRPIVAEEMPRYGEHIRHYLSCRPGMTGLWQISGRNDTTYAERVSLDAEYCRDGSMLTDVAILLKTVLVMINQRGAY